VKRWHIPLVIALVTLGLAAAGCGGGDDETATTTAEETAATTAEAGGKTLRGTVGPGFDISIEGADGLSPGAYTLVVDDKSTAHNFHLTGPGGIDVATEVGTEGEKSFELDLVAGEYSFVCDPHSSSMNGSFTVG
jgi:plastocyanin